MRSVRCDVCGTKALLAASQCPSCGHLFEMRDGSGDPLPLAHCPSCDAYYPAHVESCKWCGTTLRPEKTRKETFAPARWIAVAAFIGAVWLGLVARDPRPNLAARLRESAQPKPQVATPADTAARAGASASAGTVVPAETTLSRDTTAFADAYIPQVAIATAVIGAAPQTVAPPITAAAPVAVPAPVASAPPTSRPRVAPRWVNSVAKDWVIVRAEAHAKARIVASVGPNARVQLGESRGSWRRIRSRGIAGWVDVSRGSFAAIPSSPRRAGRVAER